MSLSSVKYTPIKILRDYIKLFDMHIGPGLHRRQSMVSIVSGHPSFRLCGVHL